MQKNRKKKQMRLTSVGLMCAVLAVFLVIGAVGALAKMAFSKPEAKKEEKNTLLKDEQDQKQAKPDQAKDDQAKSDDHTAALQAIQTAEPLQSVDAANLSDDELRSLFTVSALDENIMNRITGTTYLNEQDFITPDDLRYLRTLYKDFDGNTVVGEMIVNSMLADEMADIFFDLYKHDYPIAQMVLPDVYGGDDNISMANNNTNAFSFRLSDGVGAWANEHAMGLAVDINPLNNPMVITEDDGSVYVFPPEGEAYADRSSGADHMIVDGDYALQVFRDHGFTWGGDWPGRTDYQHFEKYYQAPAELPLAVQEKLGLVENNPEEEAAQ